MQATPSSSTGGGPAWQPVSVSQLSAPLQKRPSSQGNPGPGTQTPAPSQTSTAVQALPSSQALPGASNWQLDEQQSPSAVPPSSQLSPSSSVPLPQIAKSEVTSVRRWLRPFAGLVTSGPVVVISVRRPATVSEGSCSKSSRASAAA